MQNPFRFQGRGENDANQLFLLHTDAVVACELRLTFHCRKQVVQVVCQGGKLVFQMPMPVQLRLQFISCLEIFHRSAKWLTFPQPNTKQNVCLSVYPGISFPEHLHLPEEIRGNPRKSEEMPGARRMDLLRISQPADLTLFRRAALTP